MLGVLDAFGTLSGPEDQGIDQAKLMGNISHALIATAVGLAVAVPAVAAYNLFRRQIDASIVEMEKPRFRVH